jgi:ABC-type bacteriocin/lantibiotic exporter with double-glycine peptidase domain
MINFFKKTGILCLLLFLTHNLFAQCKSVDYLCGIKSILVVYRYFGIAPELRETSRLIRKYPDGMNMYQVSRILERKGLYARGVKIGVKELKEVDIPAIGYFHPNHFAVIKEFTEGKFKVVDLPNVSYLTDEELASSYSGFALMVSSNEDLLPQIERDGPDIRFERHVYQFRRVNPDTKLSFVFRMENSGTSRW